MKRLINIGLIIFLGANLTFGQECLDVNLKLRGYFYAGTSQEDEEAMGGFYSSSNSPKPLTNELRTSATSGTINFISFSDSIVQLSDKIQGFKVILINRTDSTAGFEAQDSRLNIVRQVYYKDSWQDIEYLPSSWCGNSYHNVYIKSDEFWEFVVPCTQGKIDAKFRFVLRDSNGTELITNEFNASFNKKQLTKEQGHQVTNIMDPYDN
ncbi:MAG: hypothetical protein ABJ004_13965 [Cyclobacteriaceae bacterium]